MFIYSLRAGTIKLVGVVCVALTVLITLIAFVPTYAVSSQTSAGGGEKKEISYDKIKTEEDVVKFLAQFGWEADSEPVQVREIIIPEDFDNGYKEYSALNKEDGFDLEIYKGERVKMWTYDILNYPGYEGKRGIVQANILVFDGMVIGGDISLLDSGGFTAGFRMPEKQ